ncbi:OstA-like protein [Chitinophaga costaii]|nr:OstA-like protein [Chitinophaga costaii]
MKLFRYGLLLLAAILAMPVVFAQVKKTPAPAAKSAVKPPAPVKIQPVVQPTLPTPKKDTTSGTIIRLLKAGALYSTTHDTIQLTKFITDVAFQQGNAVLSCDSAFLDRKTNIVDAYGHVHINQADSVNIYGDYLHYEGFTRQATLHDNARLTDGKVTITGPELHYDMNARIGTYEKGGKLVNGQSVLTSRLGYYYADTKDTYFKQDVLLVDPQYTISTDTLLYNTDTKVATFMAPTTINDGKTIMYTTSGFYDTNTGAGTFGNRPIIEDSTGTIQANDIRMDKLNGMAFADGNVVYHDTINKISLLSNHAEVNQFRKTVLATQKPVMILEKDGDTLLMASDTLFSGVITRQEIRALNRRRDSLAREEIKADSIRKQNRITRKARLDAPKHLVATDSLLSKEDEDEEAIPKLPPLPPAADSVAHISTDSMARLRKGVDTLKKQLPTNVTAIIDSAKTRVKQFPVTVPLPGDTTHKNAFQRLANAAVPTDSLEISLGKQKDSLLVRNGNDTLLNKALPSPKKDSTVKDSAIQIAMVTPPPDTAYTAEDTTEQRYVLAYHHVKIYSDSLQGVSDSAYYSTIDSTFRMYRQPLLWANINTQMSGDTIYLFTKNQHADKILLNTNGLIVNETSPTLYNQIKGNMITGYFLNNKLDWMHVDGNAESIYYIQDSDSAYLSVNKALAAIINIYFIDNQLYKVNLVKDPEGVMYPFTQRPRDKMLLPNFHWEPARQPKSKYELLGN